MIFFTTEDTESHGVIIFYFPFVILSKAKDLYNSAALTPSGCYQILRHVVPQDDKASGW